MLLEEFKSCFNGVNKMDSNIKIFEYLLYIENTFECKIWQISSRYDYQKFTIYKFFLNLIIIWKIEKYIFSL